MKRTLRLTTLVAVAAGLAFASCQKEESNSTAGNGSNNGQVPDGYVDLGLPSGLLWAKCNLGATYPEQYGDYYAWGEIETKSAYWWRSYKFCDGRKNTFTKYCSISSSGYNGFTDYLTTLEAIDDAATQKLGSGARMPTADEWRELIDNTTAEWTTMNGVNGRKFTASNGKSLFLPAAGGRLDSDLFGVSDNYLYDVGKDGHYWSSSLYEGDPAFAWSFYLVGQRVSRYSRDNGLSVRPVRSAR